MRARTFCDETGLLLHDDGISLLESELVYAASAVPITSRRKTPRHGSLWFLRCCFSGCREYGTYKQRPASSAMHAGPTGYCSGWRHCRMGLHQVRHVGSLTSLAEAYSNHIAYSLFRLRYSLLEHAWLCVRNRQTGVIRPSWGDGVPKRSSRPRNVGRRVPIGYGWRCHVEAIRRGPSLDFPHTPRLAPAHSWQGNSASTFESSEEMHSSTDCTSVLLRPCQRALLWPAGTQPATPCTNPVTEHCGH